MLDGVLSIDIVRWEEERTNSVGTHFQGIAWTWFGRLLLDVDQRHCSFRYLEVGWEDFSLGQAGILRPPGVYFPRCSSPRTARKEYGRASNHQQPKHLTENGKMGIAGTKTESDAYLPYLSYLATWPTIGYN